MFCLTQYIQILSLELVTNPEDVMRFCRHEVLGLRCISHSNSTLQLRPDAFQVRSELRGLIGNSAGGGSMSVEF